MLTSDSFVEEDKSLESGSSPKRFRKRRKFFPLNKWAEILDSWQVKRCSWLAGIPAQHALETDNHLTTYRYKNITELVLAPRELEFKPFRSHTKSYYLGLCTQVHRRETGTDPLFDRTWLEEIKKTGKKIVYCSFGTFYRSADHHRAIISFVNRLVLANIERNDIELVVALNNKTAAIINATLPSFPHIHIFGVLPQLEILSNAAVFITHAGLGSVKEAIYFKVPMLAYPLDYRWDQPANARRIEFHKLGVLGNIRNDSVETIQAKLNEILESTEYKNNISSFSNSISEEIPDFILNSCTA
jgi:UDP:flavonoid glycosyltransferase YjiC (YdhE family)